MYRSLGFRADARTVAATARHAPARGGNLSVTVCDLLVATAKLPNDTPNSRYDSHFFIT